jgi:hypothetical protein
VYLTFVCGCAKGRAVGDGAGGGLTQLIWDFASLDAKMGSLTIEPEVDPPSLGSYGETGPPSRFALWRTRCFCHPSGDGSRRN